MRFFRFLAFSLYLFFLLSIPLGVFWDWKGWLAGTVVWLVGLFYLGFRAKESLLTSLRSRPVTAAEQPSLHRLNQELSARLGLVPPQIERMSGNAGGTTPLVAAFGFSSSEMVIVVSDEVLKLSRDEWHALFCRVLTEIRFGDRISVAWLSRFCLALERVGLNTSCGESLGTSRGLVRRALFLVLAWVPFRLFAGHQNDREYDQLALKVAQAREPYVELLHKFESELNRHPITIPFALKPLFLFAPESEDPWMAVFSRGESIGQRIRWITRDSRTVT